jgi:hypothetical protein
MPAWPGRHYLFGYSRSSAAIAGGNQSLVRTVQPGNHCDSVVGLRSCNEWQLTKFVGRASLQAAYLAISVCYFHLDPEPVTDKCMLAMGSKTV